MYRINMKVIDCRPTIVVPYMRYGPDLGLVDWIKTMRYV